MHVVFVNTCHIIPRECNPFGYSTKKSKPPGKVVTGGWAALVTAVTLAAHVQEPLLNLNAVTHNHTAETFYGAFGQY